jgi:chromate transporter
MVALCSVLPGPTSSQVGMLIGTRRAGPLGAVAAWIAFTTPSALIMTIVGINAVHLFAVPGLTSRDSHPIATAAVVAAVSSLYFIALAVIATAVYNLGRSLLVTPFARSVAVVACVVAIAMLAFAPAFVWTTLVAAAAVGAAFVHAPRVSDTPLDFHVDPRVGAASFAVLLAGLIALPVVARSPLALLFATTFRAGSLVFGGGHVVLAFLTPLVGATHTTVPGAFETGYAIVQAVPGPLFTFASFLGAIDAGVPYGLGALVATIGIFLPSFLILPAALSLWSYVRDSPWAGGALAGMNAAVVGLLGATVVVVFGPRLALGFPPLLGLTAIIALLLLTKYRWPAWAVVVCVPLVFSTYNALAHLLHAPPNLRLT